MQGYKEINCHGVEDNASESKKQTIINAKLPTKQSTTNKRIRNENSS